MEVQNEAPPNRGLGMNVPLIAAGSLAMLGAAIHGLAGEIHVIRKLTPGTLPSSSFGGPRTTKTMIHVTWHITTIAFLAVGAALVLAGSVVHGDTARGIGLVAAGATAGFAAVAVGVGAAYARSSRFVFRHPGPVVLSLAAALAWWGVI
jgi:hypothetical protein